MPPGQEHWTGHEVDKKKGQKKKRLIFIKVPWKIDISSREMNTGICQKTK